jgi:hypothetical protein
VKAFFSRVAALAFEQSVLQDLEKRPSTQSQVGDGDGDLIRAYREGWVGLRSRIGTRRPHPPSLTCHFCCPLGTFGLTAVSQGNSFYDPHLPAQAPAPAPLLSTQAPVGSGLGSCFSGVSCLQLT